MNQPPQHQNQQPGLEFKMHPKPQSHMDEYLAAFRLDGKVVLVSGGDSGIGRAVSIGCAKEGANVAFIYLKEDEDAEETMEYIHRQDRQCLMLKGDIGDPSFCKQAVKKVIKELGAINVLVNNAGEIHLQEKFGDITPQQLKHTFDTNIFGMFYLSQAAIPHMKAGDCIVNTASSAAYEGYESAIDYAASKGAVVAFTRSLASNLIDKKIRVNAVAPGPVWTSLVVSSMNRSEVQHFGEDTPMGRPAQPDEIAPCHIFLASNDASYMTGQVLHPNGGSIINT
jgi:NAD(P)-dependent dehydrogenase (short-subunit alcohol dehydrogenase family)